jgi:hypothetical protein
VEAAQPQGDDARSVERAALNQIRFREANEQIDRRRRELDVEADAFPLLCECAREKCTEVIRVRLVDYETAREEARRFLVLAEHVDGADVLRRHGGYAVIEKGGREGRLVETLTSD